MGKWAKRMPRQPHAARRKVPVDDAKPRVQAQKLAEGLQAAVRDVLGWEDFLSFINFGPLLGYLSQAERARLEKIITQTNPRKVPLRQAFQAMHAEPLLNKLVSLFLLQFIRFMDEGPQALEGYTIPFPLLMKVMEVYARSG